MYTLRAVRDDDAPRLAELLSIGQKEPVTAETIRNWRQTQSPERIATCLVATDRDGRVVGYGQAVRDPWLPPADFFLYGVVDPATRRRGIGSLLFVAVVRFVHEHGASVLRCEVQEANPDGLRFVRRHGFRIEQYSSASRLDLSTFHERPFLRYVERAKASGIRFFTLADVGDATSPADTPSRTARAAAGGSIWASYATPIRSGRQITSLRRTGSRSRKTFPTFMH